MSPSVKKVNNQSSSGNMAYRSNQNRNRNFAGNYGGRAGMDMSPWDNQNNISSGGYIPGQNMNARVLNLANNLINNLVRTQNPPSLLDLPRSGGGGGGGMGGHRQRGGPSIGRNGGGGGGGGNHRRSGFQNRNSGGLKSGPKQGSAGGGISKPNASDRVKKVLAKNSSKHSNNHGHSHSNIHSHTHNNSNNINKRHDKSDSPYADVPNERFYCHLCKKHMWDADSFENHIKGRNHLTMREGVEESYRIRANMIRQEVKMAEQIKSIEIARMKGKNRNLDYCTMCDLNFHGHISVHRKSEGHLQLKKFLHPKCLECNKEFPTRIDYDSHLLSAEHLKRAAEKNSKVVEERLTGLQVITEEEELKDVRPPQKKKKRTDRKSESGGDGAGDNEGKKEGGKEIVAEGGDDHGEDAEKDEDIADHKEGEEEHVDESKEGDDLNETQGDGEGDGDGDGDGEDEEIALPVDPEDCILDFKEGDIVPMDIDKRLPKYNWTRPVGPGFITKLDCFECKLCGKFFDTDKTAEIHSRSVTHHRNFLRLMNEKANETKIAEKRAAAAAAAQERKKRKVEAAEKKSADAGNDEGKTNGSSGNEAEASTDDVEMAENGHENGEAGDDQAEEADGGEGEEAEYDEEDGEKEYENDGEAEAEDEAESEAEAEHSAVDTNDKEEAMDTQEPECQEEDKAVEKAPEKAEEPTAVDSSKSSPAKSGASTPATAENSPARKTAPTRGRGRGRGRYPRY